MHQLKLAASLCSVLILAACASGPTSKPSAQPGVALPDKYVLKTQEALPDPAHDGFNATMWMQTAAENRAIALQQFALATAALDRAIADSKIDALPSGERMGDFAELPLAIITDIDETVFDSSAFNVDLMQKPIDSSLSPKDYKNEFDKRWLEWVTEREPRMIPGAAAFLRYADSKGVKVFYVTNRKENERQATCTTLTEVRFPLADCNTQVLVRSDTAAGNPREKGERRKIAGKTHRIALMLGDNLGDFVDGVYATREAREALVDQYASYWGSRWFMLPNPAYGSWDEILAPVQVGDDSSTAKDRQELERRRKVAHLRGIDRWHGPGEPL